MPLVYHIPDPRYPADLDYGYVGVTKNTLNQRFKEHSRTKDSVVGCAIRKHNILFEHVVVVSDNLTDNEAYLLEKKLRPNASIGWNVAPGGFGGYRGPITELTRAKLSVANSGANNNYYGVKHSDAIKNDISNKLMSKPEEWRKSNASNAGKGLLGHRRPQSTKDKQKQVSLSRPKYTCEYCGKIGQYNSMIAYHGNNCKKALSNG